MNETLEFVAYWLRYLKDNPSGQMILGCLCVLGVTAVMDSPTKSKWATSRWGGGKEKAASLRQAYRQMRARLPNAVSLFIGSPRFSGDKRPLYLPDMQRGLITLGGPGSGKTRSILDPILRSSFEQGYPVILYDAKYPVQTARHAAYAQHLGYDEIQVFAPGFEESESCNILDFLRDEEDGEMGFQIAKVLDKNFRKGGNRSGDSYFEETGQQLIQAVLQFCKGTMFPDILMVAATLELGDLGQRIEAKKEINPFVRMAFMSLRAVKDSEKTVASIVGTTTSYFQRFVNRRIISAFVGQTSLNLDLTGKQLLILGLDKERQDTISPLLAVLLHLLVIRNLSRKREEPLVVVIDEAATIYLPDLANWLNWFREQGLVLVIGAQNIAQLQHLYGDNAAKSIFGGCATKALFNPQEFHSAKLFSDLLGDQVISERQRSKTRGRKQRSTSVSMQKRLRKLFEPSQFLRLMPGHCILLNPGFSSKGETGIPIQQKIKIPSADLEKSNWSERHWPKLRRQLAARTAQQPLTPTAIQQRLALAEVLLPKPSPASREVSEQLDQLAGQLYADSHFYE